MEGRQKDMGKLEIKKGKHKHILTDILKFSIFGVIMLAPFFSILSRCLYVTFNKNAKDSYYGETINESEYINIDSAPVINTSYEWKSYNILYTENVFYTFYLSDFEYVSYDGANQPNATALANLPNTNRINYYANNNDVRLFAYEDNTLIATFILTGNYLVFNFEYLGVNDIRLYPYIKPNIYYLQYNDYSYLDNAFIYSVNELHNQQIFNWTENTAIYTAINTMTTGLGFNNNNNTLALLLTYWALNTAVYIIFDIVIWAFTKLTHILND